MRKMKRNNFKFSQQYPSKKAIAIEQKINLKSLSVLNEKGKKRDSGNRVIVRGAEQYNRRQHGQQKHLRLRVFELDDEANPGGPDPQPSDHKSQDLASERTGHKRPAPPVQRNNEDL